MKISKLIFCALLVSITAAQTKKDYTIQPVPLTKIHFTDGFWYNRSETNRVATIPHVLQECKSTGRVNNLMIAAGLKHGEYCTAYQFDDSDVYKSIEAACYSLISHPDPALDKELDSLIFIISKAQEPDGYLYSPREDSASARMKQTIGPARWVNLQWSHELYVLGHLYEAAVAHYQATGKKTLLDVAIKSAGLLLKNFGPNALKVPPGHEEVEIGLIKLYRVTNDERYLNLAKFFLDIRGRGKELSGRESWGEYAQDHKPVTEQDEAVGHAVRAAYLYSAMTDIAAITGDRAYQNAVDKLWSNVVGKKLYVTGGIGSTGSGEALGANYDLPNASAYNETCSSIANMMWNYRMFQLYGDGKYLDVLERTLYNAFLSGVGLDGKSFFYPNPLQSFGTHGRSPWFTCACCPPNVARFIASLPEKFYSVDGNVIYVNLFSSNKAELSVNNFVVKLNEETNYPWDGKVKIVVATQPAGENFEMKLRIPSWAENKPIASDLYKFMGEQKENISLSINGAPAEIKIENGFASIKRSWKSGDVVELNLPMEVRRVLANENVEDDRGKVAFQRGPIVYAAEWVDNKDGYIRNILIPDDSKFTTEFKPALLNGIEEIEGKVFGCSLNKEREQIEKTGQQFTAIPYYAWAHRGRGEMSVWLARKESAVLPLAGPTILTNARITVSHGSNPESIVDQIEPKSSNDESVPFFHWWPSKGEKEWVQVDFQKPEEVSQAEIYWFDDTGVGECRVPASWKMFYKENDKWTPVYTTDKYGVEKDKFNAVTFETVKTPSIKIEIQSQKDFAGGIHELKVK